MKKFFFTALIAVSIVSSSFATEVKVNKKVTTAFQSEFKGVADVQWKTTSEFIKASFMRDNKNVDVFYNNEGVKIGTSSNITLDDLSTSAKRAFAKKYSNYIVKEAIEFEKDGEVSYFLNVSSAKETLVLQVKDGAVLRFKN